MGPQSTSLKVKLCFPQGNSLLRSFKLFSPLHLIVKHLLNTKKYKHAELQLLSFPVSHLKLCSSDLNLSVDIFITSFKSVCGKMSVNSKSEVIFDGKLLGSLFKKEFLVFLILNFLVLLLTNALHYLFNFALVIWNHPQLEGQPRWLVGLKLERQVWL